MTEVKIKPCRKCGGQPVLLVMRQCLEANVRVQCSTCRETGVVVAFAVRRAQRELLPDLDGARRQAVALWNDWGENECDGEYAGPDDVRAGDVDSA